MRGISPRGRCAWRDTPHPSVRVADGGAALSHKGRGRNHWRRRHSFFRWRCWRSSYLLPLWEKVAAEGCRMRGISPRVRCLWRDTPHPSVRAADGGAALSHKGRGRNHWRRRHSFFRWRCWRSSYLLPLWEKVARICAPDKGLSHRGFGARGEIPLTRACAWLMAELPSPTRGEGAITGAGAIRSSAGGCWRSSYLLPLWEKVARICAPDEGYLSAGEVRVERHPSPERARG
ncbi:hypothetical protein CI41S_63610 [Bradyrhizobium ivorense]|nr:hypothetical protein CI41S_63610 [Bradyrhizobium ivorense]